MTPTTPAPSGGVRGGRSVSWRLVANVADDPSQPPRPKVARPARSAVDPIRIWNWVKANDETREVFGGQQFASLFSTAFLRNHQAVRDTAELLASNPYPMSPEAFGRQADAYLQFDALDRLAAITAPTLVVVGEQDLLTPPWIAREVAEAIPGARSRSSEAMAPRTSSRLSAPTSSTGLC
jgi:pimeloyl-ACP methyl ester carboxylesterase